MPSYGSTNDNLNDQNDHAKDNHDNDNRDNPHHFYLCRVLTVRSTAAPVGAVGEMETRVTGWNSDDRQNGEDHDNDSNDDGDDHDDYFHDILHAHDGLVSIEFPLRFSYANAHIAQLYTRSCSFTTAL